VNWPNIARRLEQWKAACRFACYILRWHKNNGTSKMDLLTVVIILALLATIAVMMMGLFTMGHGGSLDKMMSNKLMWARVGIQAGAIALLILAVYLR
jgi:hypothetical protein